MKELLNRLFSHQSLSRDDARQVLLKLAEGSFNESQKAAFISVFLMRSIQTEELIGFRDALLALRIPVDLDSQSIDIVGSGGDNKNTFNISTASCFVVAGAGYKVVKHGSYGSTSISGASNVLEAHGVHFTQDAATLTHSLEKSRVAYLHAPLFNPALKEVAAVRKALGVRTFFNMLGPLVNPIQPHYQMLGVYNLKLARLYHYLYQQMGVQFTIVHSLDGFDEISLTSPFKVFTNQHERIYTPEELGFKRYKERDLLGGDSVQSAAEIFDSVLHNCSTNAQKEVVIINSAFAINTFDPNRSLESCISQARESIESGKALTAFSQFSSINTPTT